MHHPRLTTTTTLFFLVTLGCALPVSAQAQLESSAPSQSLPSDPAPPVPRIALTADPLALYLGHYGFAFAYAPTRWQSLWVAPSWTRSGNRRGLAVELGWHLWPLAHGLDGLFVGPVARAGTSRGGGARWDARVGAELGYQVVWGGVALGIAAGAEYGWRRQGGPVDSGPSARLRLSLGWAYL